VSATATVTVSFDGVSFRYPDTDAPTLSDVDLQIHEGELILVIGPTGSGKTTFLRAINGLVPHFSGGRLGGRVRVSGHDTEHHAPRELADVVGFVPQDPSDSFVCDTVEEELAYAMENLGIAPVVMRRRVEETLDLLSITDLRDRNTATLSGGQQQRVAIAAVLTASPRILVLDEPTSSLDPAAAEEVLAAITRLVHDVGLTVIMAEHRLERVGHLADRVIIFDGPTPTIAEPAEAMISAPVVPPVVELGRAMGWRPLPLSVRDARRHAAELRERLGSTTAPPASMPAEQHVIDQIDEIHGNGAGDSIPEPVVAASHVTVRYHRSPALRDVDLVIRAGEIVSIMGRNGAGKSTLLHVLAGLRSPDGGSATILGASPHGLTGHERIRRVGLVPQDPSILLYAETVDGECRLADREGGLAAGTTADTLERLMPGLAPHAHPRALSEGQRLALALAVVMAHEPRVLLLDEPTRGLDYPAKRRLADSLDDLAGRGVAVVFATHDVELAASVAHRVVVLAGGEVIADGPARDVVCHSTVFAPQVAKIMAPDEWLTVEEIVRALDRGTTVP